MKKKKKLMMVGFRVRREREVFGGGYGDWWRSPAKMGNASMLRSEERSRRKIKEGERERCGYIYKSGGFYN